jgi:hypothetical protein
MTTPLSASIRHSVSTFTSHTFLPFLTGQSQSLSHARSEFVDAHGVWMQERQACESEIEKAYELQAQQKADLVSEQEKTRELEASVQAMQLSASTLLPNQLANLEKNLAATEASNASLAKDVRTLTSIHAREIDAVTRGVQMFRDRLGVSFQVADGKLQISFAYINRAEPQKQAMIAIYVDENKEYQMHACTPALPTSQQLVDDLNKSNNFARFIGQVRKQFVQHEAATQ